MTPRQFLLFGGAILLLLGIVGFIEGDNRLFGDFLWFDNGENVAHTVLGIVALGAWRWAPANIQQLLVLVVAITALFFGILPWFTGEDFFGLANLENPADNVLHLVVGLWATYVGYRTMRAGQMAPVG